MVRLMRGLKIRITLPCLLLLVVLACSMNAWSYRFTDNYTIEAKFKINDIAAGIAFAGYEGFSGSVCVWQYSVGADNNKSVLRPHDWRVGGILLEEKGTGSVTLNTTDWFVTKIVISNNGNHADTYLRRDADETFTLIDSRDSRFDNEFRYGLVGAREDHSGSTNESATFDYIRVTDNATGDDLYYEDFDVTNGDWRNNPVWDSAAGTLTVAGKELSEAKYFPNNMFQNAIDMHYAVEADLTIESGFISIVFGLTESGSNYMWQISPNYRNDDGACNYYHLDNGNESWKAHAAGPNYPNFNKDALLGTRRHVKIEVIGNVVYTYIDGSLQDTFTQCDMTDLALLNPGMVGLRADGDNQKQHEVYIDNVKLTEYDALGNPTVRINETFEDGGTHYYELKGKNSTYASVVSVADGKALHIDADGTTSRSAKVRLILCYDHSYANGICAFCETCEEPGYDTDLSAYTIGNLGQLIRFSDIVNGGATSANGSLTDDIDMEFSHKFTPIGLNNDNDKQTPFSGTFYGNNHVISNLYVETDCEGGLFSRLRTGTIRNLGLENGHIESTANLRCGAIAGEHHLNAYMYNCYVRGTFEFVTSHAQKDAIAGEAAGGYFVNCYTTLSNITCDFPAAFGGSATNCYKEVTAEQAATTSGELCYNLGSAFRQTLGTDTYPGLDQTHGIVNKITSAGYTTQYIPTTDVMIPVGVEAYAGVVNGSSLRLVEIEDAISKEDAVILKGSEGYYSFVPTTGISPAESNNLLGSDGSVTGAAGNIYALSKQNDKVGFYKVKSTVTIPEGKAYLKYDSTPGSEVRGFTFDFDDEDATGINSPLLTSPEEEGRVYNLAGQRISKMQKGINIITGKKILK